MTKIILSTILIAALSITGQANTSVDSANKAEVTSAKTTKVTPENYGLG